jgi:hypothetical protein
MQKQAWQLAKVPFSGCFWCHGSSSIWVQRDSEQGIAQFLVSGQPRLDVSIPKFLGDGLALLTNARVHSILDYKFRPFDGAAVLVEDNRGGPLGPALSWSRSIDAQSPKSLQRL